MITTEEVIHAIKVGENSLVQSTTGKKKRWSNNLTIDDDDLVGELNEGRFLDLWWIEI